MTATTEHLPAGTLLQVDPSTLVLDDNIRADAQLDDAFVESVRTHGVRVAIEVRQDPLGQLLIIDGQRRYLASLRTQQATVPAVVVDGIGDDESRITEQWVLNKHRTDLTKAEEVAAVKRLSLFGRSPASIQKRLGASREEVDAALVVAEAPKVMEALAAQPNMDLVTAAKLAEFADDEETFADLAEAAADGPDDFEHTLELARRARAAEQARAEKVAELEAQGSRIVTDKEAKKGKRLNDLSATPPTGHVPAALTAEDHADCPHRAFTVDAYHRSWNNQGLTVSVDEVCLDRKAAGHYLRFDSSGSADLDDEAVAAAKSAEVKRVRDQNMASDAAQEVRRRFIADELLWDRDPKGRMAKVPDGAVQHVAVMIGRLGAGTGYETRTLLDEWEKGKALPAPGSSRSAAERALLRRVLATGEAYLPRDLWRTKHYVGQHMPDGAPVGVLHLRQLEAWGYGLAPIEREYLENWATGVAEWHEAEAKRTAERAARDAEQAQA